ncbi:MAG: fumarylacetoacetate hydrolase family protein [Actinobacteria bacterium]|nr:fumarylacetoacetate hydrolase family protein [Actinomycetota bacterium]
MRLATVRWDGGTRAARVLDDRCVLLDAADAVAAHVEGATEPTDTALTIALDAADLAPLVPRPPKIICLGLNYEPHIREMGRELPEHPTCFAKYAVALTGPRDDIVLPAIAAEPDYEAELAIVIGRLARNIDARDAARVIAGYTVMNDISMRDFQFRSTQWLQGKTFEASTPLGPVLVTGDEIDDASDLAISCDVDDEPRQSARTRELVFAPADVVAYLSRIMTLEPGDVIATGTPGGVGAGSDPPRFLRPGQVVRTRVEGIGELVNTCVAEPT